MNEINNMEKDTLSRNRIVSEMDQNFFVEAGAGSGKTTMLVSRMVAMVEEGIPIHQISAITFTKAAANEFYERFQKTLIERSNPEYEWKDEKRAGQLKEPTDDTRDKCKKALRDIDLCFMGTIDSFCNTILSEHPAESGIPSDAHIISAAEQRAFYRQQYVRIRHGEYGPELSEMADSFASAISEDSDVFVNGMLLLMLLRIFLWGLTRQLI